jgi:hypothetical protein
MLRVAERLFLPNVGAGILDIRVRFKRHTRGDAMRQASAREGVSERRRCPHFVHFS